MAAKILEWQHKRGAMILILIAVLSVSGCASTREWNKRSIASPITNAAVHNSQSPLSNAEIEYKRALLLDDEDSSDCVSLFSSVAESTWNLAAFGDLQKIETNRASELYLSAVSMLVESGQRFGRFDPQLGLRVSNDGAHERWMPLKLTGIPWDPGEIQGLQVVGEYRPPEGLRLHRQNGIGVPILIQIRNNRPYIHENTTSVATAVVKPIQDETNKFELNLIDTLEFSSVSVAGAQVPLCSDKSATIAYLESQKLGHGFEGFLRPEVLDSSTGLKMLEPFQPGKIPVVFIHGLASDPLTWGSLANDVFANADIMARFQFLTFSYPTGRPFTVEAAKLRRQLIQWRNEVDPNKVDPSLDRMVLIGHSMGGLVSKLQITESQNRLAQTLFNCPLEELDLPLEGRNELQAQFQFRPSSQIKRVIFIGTPHRGSKLARGVTTRLAAELVERSNETQQGFQQFVKDNRQNLAVSINRLPTSVDLLNPNNPVLQAVFDLPVNPEVKIHSIYGVGHKTLVGSQPSDGVVPAHSARHPGAESELAVDADHSLHRHPDTTAEVVRILRLHADESPLPRYSSALNSSQKLGVPKNWQRYSP